MFTAVVLGGTWLGGGRGGCVGTVFAAMTLMVTVNILLVLNVSAFFTTIAEAVILILAVLGSSIGKQSAAHECARHAAQWLKAWRTRTLAHAERTARRVEFEVPHARGMTTVWFNDGLGQSHWRIDAPERHIDHVTDDLAAFLQTIRIRTP